MVCPICKSSIRRSLTNFSQYNFCTHCKTAWRKKFTEAKYQKEYYQGSSNLIAKASAPLFKFLYLTRLIYAGTGKKDLLIDVGAGDGAFLKVINAKDKIAVEASKDARLKLQSLGIKTKTENQFLNLKVNADLISFWHVLEHLEKPKTYLKSAHNNLKKGGKLIVAVPNIDSLEFAIFGKYWFHLAPQFHHWHFSPTSIKKLLESLNFKIDFVDYLSIEHQLVGLLQSFINATTKTENILHKLAKRQAVREKIPPNALLLSLFWTTVGLPIVLIFWAVAVLLKKPGTFVVIASKR